MKLWQLIIMLLVVFLALAVWTTQTASCNHGQYKISCMKGKSNE